MHGYTFQTNLQEHKMCNKRRFGIAIHVQTYVQSTTLGPDQKLKKMVIFANFVSTHTSNVVKTLNLEICGLQYIGAESVVHDILTTSRTRLVPRASCAIWEKAVVFGVFMTVVPSQQAIDNRRYAFMSLHHTNRCHTTLFRGKTDDLMAYVPVC